MIPLFSQETEPDNDVGGKVEVETQTLMVQGLPLRILRMNAAGKKPGRGRGLS